MAAALTGCACGLAAGADRIVWDNGPYDLVNWLQSDRWVDFSAEATVADDFVLPYAARLSAVHCDFVMQARFSTADWLIFQGTAAGPGEVVAQGLGAPYTYQLLIFGDEIEADRITFQLPQVRLAAGHYYLGARMVRNTAHPEYAMWMTAGNGTIHGLTEGYFRSADLGFPDWTPVDQVNGFPRSDFAFTLLGQFVGDLNCDGRVDFADINPFVLALSNPISYGAAYPDCDIQNADIDGDGAVNLADINPFVALLIAL